jgi:hypothetical protein
MTTLILTFTLLLAATSAQHTDHRDDDLTRRGDAVMGFSHEKTTHHFRLRAGGGEIEITANDARDDESAIAIRGHLRHIARMFADGNFTAPILIHAQNPPGTDVMAARKQTISYVVEPVSAGGRIWITTSDRDALDAIHTFLRFQITDHQTGDPLTIQK